MIYEKLRTKSAITVMVMKRIMTRKIKKVIITVKTILAIKLRV